MQRNDKSGFTLIEVVVVAAIIAILAGILVPVIFNQIDEANKTKALGDCKSLALAVQLFHKDLGKWPYYHPDDCTQHYDTLESNDGIYPVNSSYDWQIGVNDASLLAMLNLPAEQPCYQNKFKLNYIVEVPPDPWGYSYVINAVNFEGDNPVWAISAGPNGCYDTTVNSPVLNNAPCTSGAPDDIGIRIK